MAATALVEGAAGAEETDILVVSGVEGAGAQVVGAAGGEADVEVVLALADGIAATGLVEGARAVEPDDLGGGGEVARAAQRVGAGRARVVADVQAEEAVGPTAVVERGGAVVADVFNRG